MMETQQLLPSQDSGDTIVRNVKTEEKEEVLAKNKDEVPLQISTDPGDNMGNVKTEEQEEVFVRIKEEEIPLQISPDSGGTIVKIVKTDEQEEVFVNYKEEGDSLQISQDPGDIIVRNVESEDEEEAFVNNKEEKIPLHIRPDSGDAIERNVETQEEAFVTNEEEAIPVLISPEMANLAPRRKRRSYEAGFKMMVVLRAEETNNSIASKEFCIDEKQVRDWRKMKADLELIPKAKKARRGLTTPYGALEIELDKWVMECRQNGYSVTRVGIRLRALQMAKDDKYKAPGIEKFLASAGWCSRFMNRFGLCLRQRPKRMQKLPRYLEEQIISFHSFMLNQQRIYSYDLADIGNMDETAMSFDLPSNRTLANLGENNIFLRTMADETDHFTVVLSCLANGTKLRPVIIFKTTTLPTEINFPPGITVRAHVKGWMDEDGTKKWLEEIWNRRPGTELRKKPSLLIWDMFRAHLSDDIKELAESSRVTLAVVPGGLASVLQPLDVSLNKPFKDRVRRMWHEWMKSGNLMKPDIELITKWVRDAWADIPEDMVQRAFHKCGISNAMYGSEYSTLYQNDISDGDDCDLSDDVYDDLAPAEALLRSTDTGDIIVRRVKMEEEEEVFVKNKEEEVPLHLSVGEQYSWNITEEHATISPYGDREDNAITTESTGGPDPTSHPSTDAECHTVFLPHHTAHKSKKSFLCSYCGKGFSYKSLLNHEKVHTGEKPYSCSECDKCFFRKSHLIRHKKVHTRVKPYSCSECGKCFSQKLTLIKHERFHSGEKPYSCSECGKCFPEKASLIRHERVHTGDKPYSCSECGKCFSYKSALTGHERVHTGEKPYSCSECGKGFSQKPHLINHKKFHTGEKPYLCSECGKCFSDKSVLTSHERVHTGQKPYSCSECGSCFSQKSALTSHERVHTR